jgi:hypothetical protein
MCAVQGKSQPLRETSNIGCSLKASECWDSWPQPPWQAGDQSLSGYRMPVR